MEGVASEKVSKVGVCLMYSRNSKESSIADVKLRGGMKRKTVRKGG